MQTKSNLKDSTPSTFLVSIIRFLSLMIGKIFFRVKFYNTENIPLELEKGLLVAPNHQTYLDPFLVCVPIKRDLRFMAWDEAFDWFFIGKLIKKLGAFPISLKRGGTIKALKDSLNFLQNGKTLVVFPEGERALSNGDLLKFKTGVIRLAMESDVPILPVTISGGNKVWARNHKFPRLGKIEIHYHPLMNLPEPKNDDTNEYVGVLNKNLSEIISSKL